MEVSYRWVQGIATVRGALPVVMGVVASGIGAFLLVGCAIVEKGATLAGYGALPMGTAAMTVCRNVVAAGRG